MAKRDQDVHFLASKEEVERIQSQSVPIGRITAHNGNRSI